MTETAHMTEHTGFTPDWISPPGDTIADRLDELGWKQVELAQRTGFTPKHISALMSGQATITADAAERLSRVLGSTTDFWLAREAKYQAALERKRIRDALKADAGWLKELPLSWLIKQGLVERCAHLGDQVRACLSFFGMASVDAWRKHWSDPLGAFRVSAAHEKKLGAVATWLRAGERQADAVPTAPFEPSAFKAALPALRALANEPDPAVFVPQLVERCAALGVAVVFVPTPPGCPASGVTRWLTPDRALLQLSLRHKSNDHLWFTFFHEVGHLLLHSKKMRFIEGMDSLDPALEGEADAFARDLLIPPADAARLATLGLLSRAAVERFASEIGIAAGIVVGRLQHERRLPYTHLNDLKVRYRWQDGVDLAPIASLLDLITQELGPDAIWLFGSRARGEARPDSDWDLLVVVPDEREAMGALDSDLAWSLRKRSGVRADIIVCTATDFRDGSTTPNTLAYEVAHRGGRLIHER